MQSKPLDTPEAAEFLRLSPGTLEVWRCKGRGPRFRKLGRKVFYTKEDLEEFINSYVVEISDSLPMHKKG